MAVMSDQVLVLCILRGGSLCLDLGFSPLITVREQGG